MLEAQPALPGSRSLQELKAGFALFGGCPRNIILKNERDILNATAGCTPDALLELLKDVGVLSTYAAAGKHIGMLIHVNCDPEKDYSDASTFFTFASGVTRKYVMKKLLKNRKKQLEKLVFSGAKTGIRGKAAEFLAHVYMAHGGEAAITDLATGQVQKVRFGKADIRYFDAFKDIDLRQPGYWQPNADTFPVIDAVIPTRRMLLQMTISNRHSVNETHLVNYMSILLQVRNE